MYIGDMKKDDLEILQSYLKTYEPIAVGEIGLDFLLRKRINHFRKKSLCLN